MVIAHDMALPSTASASSILLELCRMYPTRSIPSRPAGQTLALVGLGPGKTAHQAPWRPSRIQKRPNNLESHLCAT